MTDDLDNIISWDITTDPLNPTPLIYPVCSDCGQSYEYRRYLSLRSGDYVWAWGKPPKVTHGCRHKGGPQRNDKED